MRKVFITAVVLGCMFFSSPVVLAGQASNMLGTCLVDSLNGKERKQLAQWIFFAMAIHPEMKPFATISEQERDETNKLIGGLITRLLTEDCPNQTKTAIKLEGSMALESAFEAVGRVAMQELMTNEKVNAGIGGFEKYMDKDKINALMASE